MLKHNTCTIETVMILLKTLQYVHCTKFLSKEDFIAEKYRREPGIGPRASRLTYERSTSWAIQIVYNSVIYIRSSFLITLVPYRVCGLRVWYMYVGWYNFGNHLFNITNKLLSENTRIPQCDDILNSINSSRVLAFTMWNAIVVYTNQFNNW